MVAADARVKELHTLTLMLVRECGFVREACSYCMPVMVNVNSKHAV